ncbi:Cytochrome c oxidase polypeptide IV [Saitozyma sp. JCM 24511]|nr:Cytochrome c oxidase polypeptide IV [Saitozyma sp. JCM 24511]
MATVLRSLRSLPLARFVRQAPKAQVQVRAFSLSAIRSAGHGPPQLLGPGAKAGTVPTDEDQATGLERFELLGKLEGVDVFDMNPVEMTRMGTVDEPIAIYSLFPERHVGCTGFPADSHDTIWMTVDNKLKNHRCPECGCVR